MSQKPVRTHLFQLRLWKEDASNDVHEYRGRVQAVLNGETLHFREWRTLIEFLISQLDESEPDSNEPSHTAEDAEPDDATSVPTNSK